MKVGVLQFFGWWDRSVPLRQIYDMALERIVVMDTTGYDAVWLAEEVALLDVLSGGRVNWGAGRRRLVIAI